MKNYIEQKYDGLAVMEFRRGIKDATEGRLVYAPESHSITGELTRPGKAYILGHKLIEWEKDAEP